MISLKTIINDGGATLNKSGAPSKLKTGFMVSLPDTEHIIPLEELTEAAFEYIINSYKELVKNSKNYIGCWIDDDKLYIDRSVNIKDKSKALAIATEYKQLAIFDIMDMDSIYLEGIK